MGTLSSCLKKIGLSEHESAILRGSTEDNIKDGDAAHVAAVRAVSDYLEQLEAERAGVVSQIGEKGGKATEAPFRLDDISSLTAVLRNGQESDPASNWRESTNGFDGAKVYNYNPDTGAYWASMRQLTGNDFAITYFKGQTEIEVEEVFGSLVATKLMVADKVRAMRPAVESAGVHVENGEIERVTPAVVAESVKKSAKNTAFNPKEALAWLTGEVKKAMKDAPKASDKGAWDNANQKIKLEGIMNVEEAIGFKVFDVPGDGTFKVLNLKESLQKFLDKVESNPGFKNQRKATGEQTVAPWQKTDGSGSESEVREMLNDGDYTAAYEFSKQVGKPMVFGYSSKEKPVPYTDVRPFEVEGYEDFNLVVGRAWSGKDASGRWHVIETSTGLSIGNASSKKAVEAQVRGSLVGKNMTPEKMATVVADAIKNGDGKSQSELEVAWTAWAEEQEGGDSILKGANDEANKAKQVSVQDKDQNQPEQQKGKGEVVPVSDAGYVPPRETMPDSVSSQSVETGNEQVTLKFSNVTSFDKWIRDNEGKDVGYIELSPEEKASSIISGRIVNNKKYADQRSVYRMKDGRFVYWNLDDKQVSSADNRGEAVFVSSNDKRLSIYNAGDKQVSAVNAENAAKSPWMMTREEASELYPGDAYDKMLNRAYSLGDISKDEFDKRNRFNVAQNQKLFWAKTRSEIENDKKEAIKFAKGERAAINKMTPSQQFAPWRIKSMATSKAKDIESAEKYYDGLLEVHKDRVSEALSEGKDVPSEVLADYPDLKKSAPVAEENKPEEVAAVQEQAATTKSARDENDNPITVVTLPSGKEVTISRLNSTESMGLPGWHGPDGYLADTKDGAIKELVDRDAKSIKSSFGEKIESGLTSKEFDKWVAGKTQKQPEQLSGNGDHGVGYIALSGADNGYKTVQGAASSRVVRNDQRDMRLVFRLDNGDLVWWNSDDSNVYRVDQSDPRLTIKIDAPVESNQSTSWYSVEVDGEEYTLSTSKPLDQLDDGEFADEMLMRGYEGKVADAFRALRGESSSANVEPSPLDYTPKQYHEAYMAYVAKEYGLSPSEVKNDYDTDVARAERNKEWINAVRAAARDGQEISRQTLDKLHELNGNAVAELMHDYPEAKIPEGYQTPAGRQVEKKNAEDKKADRQAVKKSADAGEELTYNKRNRRKGGLSWEDIADKNATLQAKEVVKAKVYPKPDYQALVDGGMKPMIAHLIKQVYDSIAAKPTLGRGEVLSEASMKAYIDGVNRVMEGVLKWANDKEAIASWAGRNARMMGSSFSVMDTFSKNDTPLYFVYPNGWREHRAEVNYLGGNKFYGALQPGSEELNRANRDLKLGWPSKAEAWQKQGYRIIEATPLKAILRAIERTGKEPFVHAYIVKDEGKGTGPTITTIRIAGTSNIEDRPVQDAVQAAVDQYNGKYVLQDKSGSLIGSFDTQEEAEDGARAATKKVKEEGEVKEIGRVVTEVQRAGPARRMEGQDVTSEDVKETFGFRGVNFGNSMQGDSKALVRERQLHLNHIYDAFMDLAELLNVPPKAMSLNGLLGIAVGAQGSGKALAHFVPGVNEINITRRAGAGALAHEWGHALDHYFATMAGLATKERPYLTAAVSGAKQETVKVDGQWVTRDITFDGVRPEIVDHFRSIVKAMQKRNETPEERTELLIKAKEKAFKDLQSWLDFYRREVKNIDTEKAKVAFEKIDDIERRAKNLEFGDGSVAISKKYSVVPLVVELGEMFEAATGKKADPEYLYNTNFYANRMRVIDGQQKADATNEPAIVDTSFYRESKSADGKKKEYWSTPFEMFARAFDAYVVDSLAEKEAKNEYLGGIEAIPPKGEERNTINRAFDFLIAELKTKETEKGIAIYNREDGAPLPESEWITTGQLVDQVSDLLSQFKTDIPVTIIDRESDVLPSDPVGDNEVAATEAATSGFVYRGRIYLVRSGVASPKSVVGTLFHELLHFGIRRFVPKAEYIAQMKALYQADPWIQAKTEAWLDTQDGINTAKKYGAEYAAARGVDEALAELAKQLHEERTAPGVKIGSTLTKVVQNVINWLKNLASKFGWKPVFERLNDLEPGQQSKDYVESIFKKLREGDNPPFNMTSQWAYSDPAFSRLAKSNGIFASNENTIEVDGVQRPRMNSKGRPIHPREDGIRNFWRWFSPSPVQLLDGLSVTEVGSLKRNTEALSDFIESQAGLPESDRFTVIPSSVFAHVAGAVDNAKILDAVVRSLPVDVVNFLGSKQGSAKQVLHDSAMLEDVFSINPASDVSLGVNPSRIAELTVRVVANAGAKITGLANGSLKRNSAVLADADDSVLGAHVRKSPSGDLSIIAGFGDSKVVDAEGRPLVVYHGTAKDFTEFDLSRTGESTGNTGFYGAGAYFSQDGEDAGGYALWARRSEDDAANVISVYLALQNPLYLHINPKDDARRDRGRVSLNMIVDQLVSEGYFGKNPDKNEAGSLYARLTSFLEKADFERFMGTLYNELKGGEAVSDLARRAGFDGVMAEGFKKGENFLAEVVAFSPEQIKSATGNNGDFDPSSSNIMFAKDAKSTSVSPAEIRAALIDRFGERGIKALEQAGVLKVVRLSEAPADMRALAEDQGASALYGADGVAYLFSDRMTVEDAPGKLLHEIGEHHGLERMLGGDGWSRMKKRIAAMAKAKGSVAYGAWHGVKENYAEFAGKSDAELAGNERFLHEVLAAIGENKAGLQTSLWREMLAAIKEWLAAKGLLVDWINEGDIANLVSGSLKKVMRDAEAGLVAPEKMESLVETYFRQIVSAMKAADQLIEDCA